ncbi:sensor histidine kinase [Stomatobaculum longum]|uniref:sensor histidine kinase n=1 Tax=Stomatobaculum longum TaxID=796942 RepID=UPI0028E1928D|nr:HAMP domain-containing sensor histidine kinase [Stomatobaculum longum]
MMKFIRRSLYLKFLLGYLLFGVAGFLAVSTLSARLTESYLIKSRARTLYDEANLIAAAYSGVYDGKALPLQSAYPQLEAVSTYLRAEIWIMDKNGVIVIDSAHSWDGRTIPDFDPTATGNRSYTVGSYFGSFPETVLSVSAPITGNYRTYGYVVIHLRMNYVREDAMQILNLVYISYGIVFLLSLTFLFIFHFAVYRPLAAITEGARQFADGNLTHRIPVRAEDEMGYLATTMNGMAEKLARLEEDERRFIANVSHDFRSPLTSIKGFSEAILDGTIPPEQREKYMRRVIAESERLSKLTENMLRLNTLNPGQTLHRSVFELNALIRATAESFEPQCKAKHIHISLLFAEEQSFVYADALRIQQVLYNLTDNAIKFSPENSELEIACTEHRNRMEISVSDSGIGIPDEDLSRIFDRFFKGDRSRGQDKMGAGLGLAIAREVMLAHGESLEAMQRTEGGSRFVFTLPKADEKNLRH